jgi:hypothetical protein
MCEFCTEHGEGQTWYLQMKNYAPELLQAQLAASEAQSAGATTRLEWANRFWQTFILPAVTGVTPRAGESAFAAQSADDDKVEHYGQVLSLEDAAQVLDRVDSIIRMPCGCRFLTTGKTDQRYCFGLGLDQWGVLGSSPTPRRRWRCWTGTRRRPSSAATTRKGSSIAFGPG